MAIFQCLFSSHTTVYYYISTLNAFSTRAYYRYYINRVGIVVIFVFLNLQTTVVLNVFIKRGLFSYFPLSVLDDDSSRERERESERRLLFIKPESEEGEWVCL